MAVLIKSSKNAHKFGKGWFKDKRTLPQEVTIIISVTLLFVALLLDKVFGPSPFWIIPFYLSMSLYGLFTIRSKNFPTGMLGSMLFTNESAVFMGYVYILLGLIFSVLTLLGLW